MKQNKGVSIRNIVIIIAAIAVMLALLITWQKERIQLEIFKHQANQMLSLTDQQQHNQAKQQFFASLQHHLKKNEKPLISIGEFGLEQAKAHGGEKDREFFYAYLFRHLALDDAQKLDYLKDLYQSKQGLTPKVQALISEVLSKQATQPDAMYILAVEAFRAGEFNLAKKGVDQIIPQVTGEELKKAQHLLEQINLGIKNLEGR